MIAARALRVVVGSILAIGVTMVAQKDVTASAQSPSPNVHFSDWKPGNLHYTSTTGMIVEALGTLGCSYSLSSVETSTVDSIVHGSPTLTAISPQSGCGSIASYESAVSGLVSYVESHASGASTKWGGILLDEEPDFGFTVSQLETLNQYVYNKMNATPGVSYWFTDIGNYPGYWSQSQYTALTISGTYNGYAAPQVYTDFQASQANGAGFANNLVVTWTGAPYPYSNASYAIGKIYGRPYEEQFGTTVGYEWTWAFQAA